jgi:heme A synthase
MKKNRIHWFPVQHWALTLMLVAVIFSVASYIFHLTNEFRQPELKSTLGLLFFILYISLIYSLPSILIYYPIFVIIRRQISNTVHLKIISVMIVLLLIIATLTFLSFELENPITLVYSFSAIISATFLKIKQ